MVCGLMVGQANRQCLAGFHSKDRSHSLNPRGDLPAPTQGLSHITTHSSCTTLHLSTFCLLMCCVTHMMSSHPHIRMSHVCAPAQPLVSLLKEPTCTVTRKTLTEAIYLGKHAASPQHPQVVTLAARRRQPCRNRVCLIAGHLAGHMEDSRTPAFSTNPVVAATGVSRQVGLHRRWHTSARGIARCHIRPAKCLR